MMRSALIMAAVLLLGAADPAEKQAPGAEPEKKAAEQPPAQPLREARGKVGQVNKSKNQVVVQRDKGDQSLTLQVDKTTTIFVDGHTGTLDEVEQGEEVRASYEFKQGSNRAQWIEVSKKARPAPSKETLPETPAAPQNPMPK